jgi:hypothetical protein
MTQTVTALYDTYDDAVAATRAVAEAGIPISDISIVSNNADNRSERIHQTTHAAEDARTRAGIGAVVGGVGGLLTGLALTAIPGVGSRVAAGRLVAFAVGAAGGAVIGGAAGGLVGSLRRGSASSGANPTTRADRKPTTVQRTEACHEPSAGH